MALHLKQIDQFAVVTLDRPEALNALSFEIIDDIARAIDSAAAMPGLRALLFAGAGDKAFCAGADISELRNRSLSEQRDGALKGQAAFARLDDLAVPSIALINGYAFGGGLELALACTFRIAAPAAKLGLPEVKLGLIPGYGGTQRLPRLIGTGRALDLILTGRTVDAQEAERIGLVNAVAQDDLLEAGLSYARSFSRHGLLAIQFAKEAVQRGAEMTLAEGLRLEAELSTLAYRTADAEEGMAAFIEKRQPEFRNV